MTEDRATVPRRTLILVAVAAAGVALWKVAALRLRVSASPAEPWVVATLLAPPITDTFAFPCSGT